MAPKMCLLMSNKIRQRRKLPFTHITYVRLLAGVFPSVFIEVPCVIEFLLTVLAH